MFTPRLLSHAINFKNAKKFVNIEFKVKNKKFEMSARDNCCGNAGYEPMLKIPKIKSLKAAGPH